MAKVLDPECPACGHLGSYHDMPGRGSCVGKVDAPLDLGTVPCHCPVEAAEIPGWDAFKGSLV